MFPHVLFLSISWHLVLKFQHAAGRVQTWKQLHPWVPACAWRKAALLFWPLSCKASWAAAAASSKWPALSNTRALAPKSFGQFWAENHHLLHSKRRDWSSGLKLHRRATHHHPPCSVRWKCSENHQMFDIPRTIRT